MSSHNAKPNNIISNSFHGSAISQITEEAYSNSKLSNTNTQSSSKFYLEQQLYEQNRKSPLYNNKKSSSTTLTTTSPGGIYRRISMRNDLVNHAHKTDVLLLTSQMHTALEQEHKIHDRRYHFKIYKNCVKNTHILKWLTEFVVTKHQYLDIDLNTEQREKEVVYLANEMIKSWYLEHVTQDHWFKVHEKKTLFFVFNHDLMLRDIKSLTEFSSTPTSTSSKECSSTTMHVLKCMTGYDDHLFLHNQNFVNEVVFDKKATFEESLKLSKRELQDVSCLKRIDSLSSFDSKEAETEPKPNPEADLKAQIEELKESLRDSQLLKRKDCEHLLFLQFLSLVLASVIFSKSQIDILQSNCARNLLWFAIFQFCIFYILYNQFQLQLKQSEVKHITERSTPVSASTTSASDSSQEEKDSCISCTATATTDEGIQSFMKDDSVFPTQKQRKLSFIPKQNTQESLPPINEWPNKPLYICMNNMTVDTITTNTTAEAFPISKAIEFESQLFKGKALFRFKNVDPEDSNYFQGRTRRFLTRVQGQFKHPLLIKNVMTGHEFNKPFQRLPPSWIIKAGTTLITTLAPGALVDLISDTPRVLSSLAGTSQIVRVDDIGTEPDITTLDIEEHYPEFNNVISHRKRALSDPKALQTFQTNKVYTFDFYQSALDFSTYSLHLGFTSVDLSKSLNGQPIQCMARSKTDGKYLWNFQIWHESLISKD